MSGAENVYEPEIRQFLSKPAGSYLLRELTGRRPQVVDPRKAQRMEDVAIKAAFAEGYTECIKQILEISATQQTQVTDSQYIAMSEDM